jgi:hypothetical protein
MTRAASPTSRAGQLAAARPRSRRAPIWPRAWRKRWRCSPRPTESDDALYFYRLALFHEDMHAEAGIYMAQALDIRLPESLLAPAAALPQARALELRCAALDARLAGDGFAFDNELAPHAVAVAAFEIDSEVVSWRALPAFVEPGGAAPPRYLRRQNGGWQRRVFGQWRACRSTRRRRTSAGTKPTPGAAGPAVACRAKRSGRWRR